MGATLSLTVFRPRITIFPAMLEEGESLQGVALRSRIKVTHCWSLAPLSCWYIGPKRFTGIGPYGQRLVSGWQIGPFGFEEERVRSSWPIAVEEAARAIAIQQRNMMQPELEFRVKESPTRSWHVVARDSDGKRLEMDFDDYGKPAAAPRSEKPES